MYYIVSESAANDFISKPYKTEEAAEIAFYSDPAVDPTVCCVYTSQELIDSLIAERDHYKKLYKKVDF